MAEEKQRLEEAKAKASFSAPPSLLLSKSTFRWAPERLLDSAARLVDPKNLTTRP